MPVKRKKRRPNPLKLDPTRTATLRRAFATRLKQRFARLRFELRKLLVDEDALGLVEPKRLVMLGNVFCPTGEGGGVDPTCSPSGSGGGGSSSGRIDRLNRRYGVGKYREGMPGSDDPKGDKVASIARDIVKRNTPAKDIETTYRQDAGLTELWTGEESRAMSIVRDKRRGKEGFEIASGASSVFIPEDATREEIAWAVHKVYRVKPPKELREHIERKKLTGNLVVNDQRWRFLPNAEKIKQFQEWLRQQFGSTLIGRTEEELWEAYIEHGYRKGAGRAWDDTTRSQRAIAAGKEEMDFIRGTRDQFLRRSFGQPVSVEKVKLLAGRSFDDLENVTADMAARMSRTLTDGLVQGKGPREVARDLDKDLDIGKSRALLIARTELIRAHAEGQLTALEDLGVEEVGVTVEWVITPDEKVCPECEALEGVILKIAEARGMLPRHPGCRCSWVPSGVGEASDKQKDSKSSITDAIRQSQRRGNDEDEWGPGQAIAKERPESILNQELLEFSHFLHNHEQT